MTDIMSAIGLAQLERYDDMLSMRKTYLERYETELSKIGFDVLSHYTDTYSSSGHLCLTRIIGKDSHYRNGFITSMAERGIACNVHYKPLPMHTAYKSLGFDISDFPNAYNQFANEVSLPLNTKMSMEDVEYVIENIKELIGV